MYQKKKTLFDADEQKKIGMLTPSSNTSLEPVCSAMVCGMEKEVTMHYARFRVTEISLRETALHQFDYEPMLRAAGLLADADVDVIVWNGTSGGWLGFDKDRMLCEKIESETGIPATTSMLAQLDSFAAEGVRTIHLVTPYIGEINRRLRREYQNSGFTVINDACLEQTLNRSFARAGGEKLLAMCREVSREPADAISIVCTNLPSMWYVPEIETICGVTVHDTINTAVWKAMKIIGLETIKIKGWGRVFSL